MPKLTRYTPFTDRFWAQVEKGDGCWSWSGAKNGGYGIITHQGVSRRATHAALFIAGQGWPAQGMVVCHRCDNPCCVRPDHLFVGTVKDNNRDAIAKGRRPKWPRTNKAGERNGNAKLTAAQVAAIRVSAEQTVILANRYLISRSTVHRLRRHEGWKG